MHGNRKSLTRPFERVESSWGKKRYLAGARGVAAIVGVCTHLVTIRLLEISDFAAIALALGVIEIATAFLSFGLPESLTRELSARGRGDGAPLIRFAFAVALVGATLGGVLTAAAVPLTTLASGPSEAASLLFLGIPFVGVLLSSRISTAVLRGFGAYGPLLASQITFPVVRLGTVALVASLFGLEGYWAALISTELLNAVFLIGAIRRIEPAALPTRPKDLWNREAYDELRAVSHLDYGNNLSSTAWMRLPFILGAVLLPETVVGAAAVAHGLAMRLGLASEITAALVLPRLTAALANGPTAYLRALRREGSEVIAILGLTVVAATLAWHFAGEIALGPKWTTVGDLFYAFVGIQAVLILTAVAKRSVIVPAKATEGLLLPLVLVRACVVVLVPALAVSGLADRQVLPTAMFITACGVATIMTWRSLRVVTEMKPNGVLASAGAPTRG